MTALLNDPPGEPLVCSALFDVIAWIWIGILSGKMGLPQ
jgi:hypothetical protein